MAGAGFPTPHEEIKEALQNLPPSSGQRDVENELVKRQKTRRRKPIKSPSLPYTTTRARPSPEAITARVRNLVKDSRIIDATVEAAFPAHNPGYWPMRVVWALKHRRDPHSLNDLPDTWHNTWPEWDKALRRYGVEVPPPADETATRYWRDQLRRTANAQYAFALEESLTDQDRLEHLWGFGIPNKGHDEGGPEWVVTPLEEAEPYIYEIRRQSLSQRRQSEPYRDKAKATAATPDTANKAAKRQGDNSPCTDMSVIDIIDGENSLARSRGNWVWTHQIPKIGD